MRIRAINAVSGIHGKERVQMIQDFQSMQERLQSVQELPPPKSPLANNLQINPTEAARVLDQTSFSEEFLQDNASSTSIMATSRDVNLLAQSDAISQEMIQDLKGSMSLSGKNLGDIILPERQISAASSTVEDLNDSAPAPPPPPSLFQPEPSSELDTQQTGALPPPPSPQPIPTNIEEPILEIPVDQTFSPNRKDALPPVSLPRDITYVNDRKELENLERLQESHTMFQLQHEDNESQIRRPEEYIEKERIPKLSLNQPIEPQGKTGIPAVEKPEELMAPEQKNPIQELQRSVNSDIVLSIATTLL